MVLKKIHYMHFSCLKLLTTETQVAIYDASKRKLSPIAQSVEQVAVNHLVASSSLARGARFQIAS